MGTSYEVCAHLISRVHIGSEREQQLCALHVSAQARGVQRGSILLTATQTQDPTEWSERGTTDSHRGFTRETRDRNLEAGPKLFLTTSPSQSEEFEV